MKPEMGSRFAVYGLGLMLVISSATARAASPSVEQALKLLPIQKDVDFDRPEGDQIAKCKISARRLDGHVGWIVESPEGTILRRFVDTNSDNVVDQWSYFKDGLEVYRDSDKNYNGKADQYRWFHTAGGRWGLDENEDGKIDSWKAISAEEVTAEVIAALATRDAKRFARLVLTPAELESLGLGEAKAEQLAEKIKPLLSEFKDLAARQKIVTNSTRWLQFSGNRPGIVPAGTDGSSKDIHVYENVVAVVQTGERHGQVQIGTLVRVGERWRVIDVPEPDLDGQTELVASGFFFRASPTNRPKAPTSGPSEAAQELLAQLETLDKAAADATKPEEQAKLNARRANLLEQIAEQAKGPEDRSMWLRQLADMVSAAVQQGTYPEGVERLETLLDKLEESKADKDLVPYVTFRKMTAEYGQKLLAKNPDFAKIQTEWIECLEKYVADYPNSPDSAEAMLQLAMTEEFAGREEEAKKWYERITKSFPNAPAAKKAVGAHARLESVGKQITLRGKNPSGGVIDLAKYRGKVVLIQYWATWCEPCKTDMATIKELLRKYGNAGFSVIGVNLDTRLKELSDFLTENRLPWPQIFEEGGLDSRPANELGILTVPTMILIDQQGKVVNRNIQVAELDREVKKLLR